MADLKGEFFLIIPAAHVTISSACHTHILADCKHVLTFLLLDRSFVRQPDKLCLFRYIIERV